MQLSPEGVSPLYSFTSRMNDCIGFPPAGEGEGRECLSIGESGEHWTEDWYEDGAGGQISLSPSFSRVSA